MLFFFFFFFFQAEDGIRDLYVTGVQTCALPISFSTRGGGGAGTAARALCLLPSGEPCAGSLDVGARARLRAREGRRGRHVSAHGARGIARAARSRRPAHRGRETRRMSLGPLMIDLAGTSVTAEDRELLHHPLVGGVILFTRNYTDPAQLTALASAIHAERTPPLIVAVDHEGGR